MTMYKALLLISFVALINFSQQTKASCNLTIKNIDELLADEHSTINESCFKDDELAASIITRLTFEHDNAVAAATFFNISQVSKEKRSILPSKLISTFHKDVLVRRSKGLFKQTRSCEQVQQRLELYQLVSEKLNLSRTTVWEDFHLIQAYYHQLLGEEAEAESKVDTIFEGVSVSELPDFSLLSDIGYELTDYQLSFYLKLFDKARNLERLSKDESQKGLYEAVLKERAMYKQQLKASAKPKQEIRCQ